MPDNIKVSSIQTANLVGNITENLRAAETLIEQAAAEGGRLAALPELSSCGYAANEGIWNFGEPTEGVTAKWASSLAKKLNIHIGAGFLECDGHDFYNSYLLANPEGGIDGIVRKNNAESYVFKSAGQFHDCFIDTAVGRVGIGICADSHSIAFFRRIREAKVDLLLLPHGWATPYQTTKHVSQQDTDNARDTILRFGGLYAKHLGIPVVFINASGETQAMPGMLGKLMPPERFRLQGGSQIVESGSDQGKALADGEGYLVAEVTPGMKRVVTEPCVYNGVWLHPGSRLIRSIILPVDDKRGKRQYQKSALRREKAAGVKST